MVFLLSLEGDLASRFAHPARKSFPRSASQFLYTVPDLPGIRSTQADRGMVLRASGRDAGELAGPVGVGLGGATRLSSTLGTRTPAKRAESSDAAVQARLDRGPHGVPRGCQLSSQSGNGGSLEAQLSDRPHTHTRPGRAHRVVLLDEGRDLAGAFSAHPAPYFATGTLPQHRPWARRSPPPRARDRDREQVTPQPGQPAQWSQDSLSSTRAHSRRAAETRRTPSKSTSRSHRPQRPSHTEQQQGA